MLRKIISLLLIIFFHLKSFALDTNDVKKFVDNNINEILAIVDNSNISDGEKTKALNAKFVSIVDVNWMAKFTLGIHWRDISKKDINNYLNAYKEYVLNSYVPNFKKYNSSYEVKVLSVESVRKNEFLVKTNINSKKDLTSYSIDFRLISKDQNLFIFDIITEGVSMIATQRVEFNSIINRYGISYLIDKLEGAID